MTDQNSQFFAILTAVGKAKQANADALGVPWTFAQMGVGDANNTEPMPNEQQTSLINERRRAPLNQLKVDPNNSNIIIAEQVIPESVGGWWIREIGLYDSAGDLVAVANCAPSFKPLLSQGSGRTQIVRMNLIVSNTANVELKIDPSVVLATRSYVDSKVLEELYKLDSKQSVRAATTGNIALTGLQSVDGVALEAGERVLVKNQTIAKDNGLYTAAAGAWVRAADADSSAKVTSALIVSVEQGMTLADTRWQLVTDGVIVLGVTRLVFSNVTQGFAPLSSPAFTDNPTAPTPAQFSKGASLANMEALQRALGSIRGAAVYNAAVVLTASDIGKAIRLGNSGYTVTLPLADANIENGAVIYLMHTGTSGVITVAAAGADHFAGGVGYLSSVSLGLGDTLFLVKQLNGEWTMWGSAQLPQSSVMAGPNWTTPPQFDASKRLATMEAVKRFGLQASGRYAFNSNQTLTAAHAGATVISFGTSTLVFSLPLASTFQVGARIEFFNEISENIATINRAGADTIVTNGSNLSLTSISLLPGDTLTLECNGTGWDAVSGSAQLGFSGSFASLPAASGYQKLPSGLIVQWGSMQVGTTPTTFAYPIAFPAAVFNVQVSASVSATIGSSTLTGIPVTATSNGIGVYVLAIGK